MIKKGIYYNYFMGNCTRNEYIYCYGKNSDDSNTNLLVFKL